jgi:hypothetical protein
MTRIPSTIGKAQERLTEIGGLLQATEWEKAAIVAAFVGTPGKGKSTNLYSTHEFAAFKITGLSSAVTVQRYVDAWMEYSGYERPEPGMEIPTDLPEWGTTVPQRWTAQAHVATQPGAIAAALEDPVLAAKVAERLSPSGLISAGLAVDKARIEHKDDKAQRNTVRRNATKPLELNNVEVALRHAREYIVVAAGRIRGVDWTPEQVAVIVADLDRITAHAAMLKSAITGVDVVDWDAEMVLLNGGK